MWYDWTNTKQRGPRRKRKRTVCWSSRDQSVMVSTLSSFYNISSTEEFCFISSYSDHKASDFIFPRKCRSFFICITKYFLLHPVIAFVCAGISFLILTALFFLSDCLLSVPLQFPRIRRAFYRGPDFYFCMITFVFDRNLHWMGAVPFILPIHYSSWSPMLLQCFYPSSRQIKN